MAGTARCVVSLGVALGLSLASSSIHATEIVPVSYVFDQARDCGSYCYYDGSSPSSIVGELTDGKYGAQGWAADLGSGNAAEWVGWANKPLVNIDFDFGAVTHIAQISFGSTQDRLDDVVLPSLDVYKWDGSSWDFVQSLVVPEDAANNRPAFSPLTPHVFLTLSGLDIDASKIRVAAKFSSDGPWTFVDEVDFYDAAPVPEPTTLALMAGGLAAAVRRRRATR